MLASVSQCDSFAMLFRMGNRYWTAYHGDLLHALGMMRRATRHLAGQFDVRMSYSEALANVAARSLLLTLHDAIVEDNWEQLQASGIVRSEQH